MKKLAMFMSALALLAVVSCDNGDDAVDFDTVALDGFYVTGEAVGTTEFSADYMMNSGFNEVTKSPRSGMFEKYIWIEADKEFELVRVQGKKGTRYSADLKDFDVKDLDNNPSEVLQRGILQIGGTAPAMKVAETGMYHIILDLNETGDLGDNAWIVLAPAKWGVRGGMNGWGYTEGEMKKDGNVITWTVTDTLSTDRNFKFAHCHGWKINLDDLGQVKAEVSFGDTGNGLDYTVEGGNISVDKPGIYEIVLKYEMKSGAYAKSFSYTTTFKEAVALKYPEKLYIMGSEFGNWNAEEAPEMVRVTDGWKDDAKVDMAGNFWAVRYLSAGAEFKFTDDTAWKGSWNFGPSLSDGSNIKIDAAGLYMIYVDFPGEKVTISPAEVYGYGNPFSADWSAHQKFEVTAEGKATATVTVGGDELRMYSKVEGLDWWQTEFQIVDGKIEYRGTAEGVKKVGANKDQVITLDFNAGTGSIQ